MTFKERAAIAEEYIRERTGWHGLGSEAVRGIFPDLFGEKPTAVIVDAHDIAHAPETLVRKVLTFEQAETLLQRAAEI
jgi:hypothetical protein